MFWIAIAALQIIIKCRTQNNNLLLLLLFLATLHSLWDLSSPTRDRTRGPRQWKRRALTTELPGNSQQFIIIIIFIVIIFQGSVGWLGSDGWFSLGVSYVTADRYPRWLL